MPAKKLRQSSPIAEATLSADEQKQLREFENVRLSLGLDREMLATEAKNREISIDLALRHLAIARAVLSYTVLDDALGKIILNYFVPPSERPRYFWQSKRFRVFNHHILDEMYLLKKMQLVHAINPLPKNIRATIAKVNAVRNAMAHSMLPENRKEYRKRKKVTYNGKSILTVQGLNALKQDTGTTLLYLAKLAFPNVNFDLITSQTSTEEPKVARPRTKSRQA